MGYMTKRLAGTVLLGVALLSGMLSGCSGSGSAGSANGAHLGVSAFASAVEQPGAVVVDVRTPSEFAAGHLAKAVNLDVQSGDFAQRIAGLDKNASYALYCHSGNRSGVALQQMTAAGFNHVVDLTGGVSAWTSDGRQLVTGP
jgi:rhodanese-related sulfurtransferase